MESDTSLFEEAIPKIKNFFEEEYKKQYTEIVSKLDQTSDYYKFLQNDFDSENTLQVSQRIFFRRQRKCRRKSKSRCWRILKDKKKLLSFESPTRFIFSIWALQEGWDNPNVFTICKLSNQGSEISKLQQIGRGLPHLRKSNLQRNTLKNLNDAREAFWENQQPWCSCIKQRTPALLRQFKMKF